MLTFGDYLAVRCLALARCAECRGPYTCGFSCVGGASVSLLSTAVDARPEPHPVMLRRAAGATRGARDIERGDAGERGVGEAGDERPGVGDRDPDPGDGSPRRRDRVLLKRAGGRWRRSHATRSESRGVPAAGRDARAAPLTVTAPEVLAPASLVGARISARCTPLLPLLAAAGDAWGVRRLPLWRLLTAPPATLSAGG